MALTWSFGGVALSTYGRVTLINDYLDMPERRGENQVIPYSHGSRFVQKYFNERKMVFGIAIRAANAAGLETVMDALRAKLAPSSEQVLSCTREDASVRTALASVNVPLQVERRGSKTVLAVIEFALSDPFFRSSTLYQVTSDAIDGTPTPQTLTVVNGGAVEETNPTILLTGPLSNPVILNTTNGASLTFGDVIGGGDTVTIGVLNGEYYATHSVVGNIIGAVSHSGSSALMVLNVGNNAITITDGDYAGGTVKFSYYPAYL